MTVHAIVAMTRDGVIGKRNALPWKLKGDLPRFKRLTMGQTVIMGLRTFESIGRPLPGRNTIVLDDQGREIEGLAVARSIAEAMELARSYGTDIFVIGGASVYAQMLPLVEVLHVSHVKKDYDGDVYFPEYNRSAWREVAREEYPEFEAVTYERVKIKRQAL
ncbi:MAG: hypothetical protein COT71_02925 [Candidatus Andersenbacteria bacterium CG10_big_fil_rev_8_21_14_0_10_54_11]|uniref:Dihydrofolate reductase n=1 Tax=Candidatus Andersenbacteria bacterium CG10_big_fil_rev_8_21_14_0_10_54_11 TaxID=1974485 RepID=A0A2M6WZ32_9BACT|nr:MAG: hypothetical protein COT71_02925 [Candidatus Andersenbacteria bacterium CG10_big_fil_rev_8_21_14_0_10_54_11]